MLKRLAILLLFLFVSAGYLAAERALYVVTTQTLNVRRGPGKQYYAYGEFHKGDHILVKGKTGVWNVGGGNYAGDGIYFGIFRKQVVADIKTSLSNLT